MKLKSELLGGCCVFVLTGSWGDAVWLCKAWNSEGIRTRSQTHVWLPLCLAEGSAERELCVKGNRAVPAGFTSVDLT